MGATKSLRPSEPLQVLIDAGKANRKIEAAKKSQPKKKRKKKAKNGR
jgi:hypothetical protein